MNTSEPSVRTLFAEALEILNPEERAAYLDRVTAGDADLRRRLEILLGADSDAGGFLRLPEHGIPSTSAKANDAPRIGAYRLVKSIGEGGCGTVYLAEQERPLRRQVALKVIKLGMDTEAVVARFQAERQALALMDHPGIAKIHDAGTTGAPGSEVVDPTGRLTPGRPYFVMEWVQGPRLTDYCDEHRLAPPDRLELFIQVCRAVQHAHQKGIIHRDLKPSNILVSSADGKPLPKVIDFGIAKATADQRLGDHTLYTAVDQFLGTPAYMSPEQAGLAGEDIDTRSDVYSLGVLLYELLVGRTPFDARELMKSGLDEMRRTIREREPARPSTRLTTLSEAELAEVAQRRGCEPPRLPHLLRGDLDWIVMKCLEKERSRRYETANGLAADLRRYLDNEPVVARPPTTVYRLQKLARRNKLAFAAVFAVGTALLIGLVSSMTQARKAAAALIAAESALYAADVALAQHALEAENLGRSRELLLRHLPAPNGIDLRSWEWGYLWTQSQPDALQTLATSPGGIDTISISSDGRNLAYAGRNRILNVLDLSRSNLVATLSHESTIICARFSNDGTRLAALTSSSGVYLWDTASLQEVDRIPVVAGRFIGKNESIAFAPTFDSALAVGDERGVVTIWQTRERPARPLHAKKLLNGAVRAIDYSSDGSLMAAASSRVGKYTRLPDGRSSVVVCKADTLDPIHELSAHDAPITSLSFSPNRRLLASASWDGQIAIWNLDTSDPVRYLTNHSAWVADIEFLADGKTLVSVGADHSVRLWSIPSLQPLTRLRGHESEVHNVELLTDGVRFATSSKDGTVRTWSAVPAQQSTHCVSLPSASDWCVSPTSDVLMTIHDRESFQLWETGDMSAFAVGTLPITNYSTRAISPGGKIIVFGTVDGKAQFFAPDEPLRTRKVALHVGPVTASAFSSDGQRLATVGGDFAVVVLEGDSWQQSCRFSLPHDRVNSVAYSHDGTILAVAYQTQGEMDGWVRLWSVGTGRELATIRSHPEQVWDLAFSHDGRWLATGSAFGSAKVWDLSNDCSFVSELRGRKLAVNSVAFSRDDKRIAVSGDNGETKIWDAQSFQELITLRGGNRFVVSTRFIDENTLWTFEEFFLRGPGATAFVRKSKASAAQE